MSFRGTFTRTQPTEIRSRHTNQQNEIDSHDWNKSNGLCTHKHMKILIKTPISQREFQQTYLIHIQLVLVDDLNLNRPWALMIMFRTRFPCSHIRAFSPRTSTSSHWLPLRVWRHFNLKLPVYSREQRVESQQPANFCTASEASFQIFHFLTMLKINVLHKCWPKMPRAT